MLDSFSLSVWGSEKATRSFRLYHVHIFHGLFLHDGWLAVWSWRSAQRGREFEFHIPMHQTHAFSIMNGTAANPGGCYKYIRRLLLELERDEAGTRFSNAGKYPFPGTLRPPLQGRQPLRHRIRALQFRNQIFTFPIALKWNLNFSGRGLIRETTGRPGRRLRSGRMKWGSPEKFSLKSPVKEIKVDGVPEIRFRFAPRHRLPLSFSPVSWLKNSYSRPCNP